jgi:hypothetical protein
MQEACQGRYHDVLVYCKTISRRVDRFHAESVNDNKGSGRPSLSTSARNVPVYHTGTYFCS